MFFSPGLGGWEFHIWCLKCTEVEYSTPFFDYAVYHANKHYTRHHPEEVSNKLFKMAT